ncbi:MAG TPA: hypothetical protein VGA44_04390 [Steroidobacteraceae bacterium]
MRGFLTELRERNVDRAALAYAGAGWLIAQGGQLLAEAYQWPGSAIRLRTRRKLDIAIAVLVIAVLGAIVRRVGVPDAT